MRERTYLHTGEMFTYALKWQQVEGCHKELVVVLQASDGIHGFALVSSWDEFSRVDDLAHILSTHEDTQKALATWLDLNRITDCGMSEAGYELHMMGEEVTYEDVIVDESSPLRFANLRHEAEVAFNVWCARVDRESQRADDTQHYADECAATMDAWEGTLNDHVERHVAERRYVDYVNPAVYDEAVAHMDESWCNGCGYMKVYCQCARF